MLYKFTQKENIDLFVFNTLFLNTLTFSLFVIFDDFKNRSTLKKRVEWSRLKSSVFFNSKNQFKNIFNWIVFLFPLLFYINIDSTLFEKTIVFYFFSLILLKVSIVILSTLIKIVNYKNYYVYIIIIGILFQIQVRFFSSSLKDSVLFAIGMILLSCLSVIIFSSSIKKESAIKEKE